MTSNVIPIDGYALDPERAVLGALAIDPQAYWKIGSIIGDEDFYLHQHRILFGLFAERARAGAPVDFVLIWQDIIEQRLQKEFRHLPASYISELILAVPTAANIKHYANIVKKNSQRRQSLNTLSMSTAKINNGHNIAAVSSDTIEDLQRINIPSEEAIRISEATRNAVLEIEHMQQHDIAGYSFGRQLSTLDHWTLGAQPGQFILVAARPGMGKSTLVDQWLEAFNVQALLFSLEMPAHKIAGRRIQRYLKCSRQDLKYAEKPLVEAAARRISQSKLQIDDKTVDLNQLIPIAINAVNNGAKVIAIDYLQLIKCKAENRVQEVSKISRELKGLAQKCNVPVIAVSQLSRKSTDEKRRPDLHDLRDSGQLEQDADLVLMIYGEMDDDKKVMKPEREIWIRKQREGPTGMIPARFLESYEFVEMRREQ